MLLEGNSEDTGSPAGAMAPLRNVSTFQSEEDKYGELDISY
jgi:hypothetical protein